MEVPNKKKQVQGNQCPFFSIEDVSIKMLFLDSKLSLTFSFTLLSVVKD